MPPKSAEKDDGQFDPYRKWLGIPKAEQPPNHYKLLGIPLFEDDLDVIENAADRQMAHIRTYQGGARAEHSQKLLNELATAKLVLLAPAEKAAYDAKLRASVPGPVGADPQRVATAHGAHDALVVPMGLPPQRTVTRPVPLAHGQAARPASTPPPAPPLPAAPPASVRDTQKLSAATTVADMPRPSAAVKRRLEQSRRENGRKVGVIVTLATATGVLAVVTLATLIASYSGKPKDDNPDIGKKPKPVPNRRLTQADLEETAHAAPLPVREIPEPVDPLPVEPEPPPEGITEKVEIPVEIVVPDVEAEKTREEIMKEEGWTSVDLGKVPLANLWSLNDDGTLTANQSEDIVQFYKGLQNQNFDLMVRIRNDGGEINDNAGIFVSVGDHGAWVSLNASGGTQNQINCIGGKHVGFQADQEAAIPFGETRDVIIEARNKNGDSSISVTVGDGRAKGAVFGGRGRSSAFKPPADWKSPENGSLGLRGFWKSKITFMEVWHRPTKTK